MKKLLLALLILSSSMQISCSNEKAPTSNKIPTLQQLALKQLKPTIMSFINHGNDNDFEEVKEIKERTAHCAPNLF